MKTPIAVLIALCVAGCSDSSKTSKTMPVALETLVVLSAPLPGKEGDLLKSTDIGGLVLSIADEKMCEGKIFIPTLKLKRADLTNDKGSAVLPEQTNNTKPNIESAAFLAGLVGKKPSAKVAIQGFQKAFDIALLVAQWVQPGNRAVTSTELARDHEVQAADFRFVLVDKTNSIDEEDIRSIFSEYPETYLVKDKSNLKQEIKKRLCPTISAQSTDNAKSKSIAILYMPSTDNDTTVASTETEACNSQWLNEGIQFTSLALDTRETPLRQSNLDNAYRLFDRAVNEARTQKTCCAKALMNRGLVRDLRHDSELALRDLKEAEQCGGADRNQVLYNLACYYSKHHSKTSPQLDLALESLEKAVEAGFNDCDQILRDSDLTNIRKATDYKDRFLTMLHKHGLYCK